LIGRVSTFKSIIGVDGVILSKMDLDVKGGGVISVYRATGVPVLYFGTGQAYGDLIPFKADEVMRRVFG
jgi:signal recognition particle GTPase